MTDELKPCPFCGEESVSFSEHAIDVYTNYGWGSVSCPNCDADGPYQSTRAEAAAAWNRRAQPEPAASADPSRDAYEGCREDLLDWKRRALKAEETCRQLTRALGDKVNGPTFMGEPVLPDAAPSVAPEPGALTVAAVRALPTIYSSEIDGEESDGTPRYWRDRPFVSRTKLERLIASAHSPRAPLTEEIESADKLLRHLGLDPERCRTEGGSLNVSRIKTLLADAAPSVAPEPVAWEGGEGWESLAWELCADENGEDACNELIWEGGPIPEPWGDRWMKYEGEAKRLIALVHKHAAHPPRAPLPRDEIRSIFMAHGFTIKDGCDDLKEYVYEAARALEQAHGIGGK